MLLIQKSENWEIKYQMLTDWLLKLVQKLQKSKEKYGC